MAYVNTPPANTLTAPSAGEVATYQTGTDRFNNLAALGGFRNFNISADPTRFNCFAWSVGFTDRWIQGGSPQDMVRLYEAYMFRQCLAAGAEVELYIIPDAPPTLERTISGRPGNPARGRAATADRVIEYANPRAVVMHAHRRDNAALDAPPGLGCSSKLAAGPLIVHNRLALEDRRPWVSTSPQIVYGTIYQWWQRDPRAHPTLPGNAAIAYPVPGHYPDDRVFSNGYGTYPPGHPGNTIGLPAPAGNNNAPGSTTAKRPGSSGSTASTASKTNSSGHSRTSSGTSVSSGASKAAAAPTRPWVFIAASGKAYPNIPLVAPYARIPAPSAAAVTYANNFANAVNKASPAVVKAFNQAWAAFIAAWGEISRSQFCDDASLCTQTSEFKTLVALASAKGVKPRDIVALIVSKLATEPKSFVGVFAYNALEKDGAFLVYRKDLFNYNVLQRHANLIVEMNSGRK